MPYLSIIQPIFFQLNDLEVSGFIWPYPIHTKW